MSEGSAKNSFLSRFSGSWREVLVALILSATAIAAAWSTFQASKWGGTVTVALNEAAVHRTIAASDISQASRDISGDRATFSSFVLAYSEGNEVVARILFTEFRDEVQPLVEAWLEEDPFNNPSVGSPFDDDSYTVIETLETASKDLEDAENFTTVALEAKTTTANYTLTAVLFAVVLFLAGLSAQFKNRTVAIGMMSMAALLLLGGVGILVWLPTLV